MAVEGEVRKVVVGRLGPSVESAVQLVDSIPEAGHAVQAEAEAAVEAVGSQDPLHAVQFRLQDHPP
jgi:hypothetical protein